MGKILIFIKIKTIQKIMDNTESLKG